MNRTKLSFILLAAAIGVAGCASSSQKARKEQRDKLVQTSKLYCEWISGEQFQDTDVALNVNMAQRCDSEKNFTISQYRTASDIQGMMYCCVPKGTSSDGIDLDAKVIKKDSKKTTDKVDDKKVEEGQ